jgi:hypothetical protein
MTDAVSSSVLTIIVGLIAAIGVAAVVTLGVLAALAAADLIERRWL